MSQSKLHGDNAWDKWVIMFAIGVFVGIIGFLVKSATSIIFEQKYKLVEHFIEEASFVWVCTNVPSPPSLHKETHIECQSQHSILTTWQ